MLDAGGAQRTGGLSTTLAALRELLDDAGAALHRRRAAPARRVRRRRARARPTRYQAIRDEMRGLVSRTPTAALHVHVGMPDPETAIDVCNRLRAHLPLLQALAAHSPFWFGRDSGLASAPLDDLPRLPALDHPAGRSPAGSTTQDVIRWCAATAEVPDYTYLWWDIRPSPNLGHGRGARDGRAEPAGVRGRARRARPRARRRLRGRAEEAAPPTEALMESSFRAARDGVDATIWWRGAIRPIREVGADALALARPYARELDGEDALEEIERILREGGGADRMRAAHASGGMDEMLAHLAEESLGLYASTQTTSPIRSQS